VSGADMSCDVYVLPAAGCDRVWVYPSAPHPSGGGRPHGPVVRREILKVDDPRKRKQDDELAVILLMEAFTTS
jgi:hypothetical protein